MGKLSIGDYELELNQEPPPSVIKARNLFLHCVQQHVPQVLDDLLKEVFPLFLLTRLYYEADKRRKKDPSIAYRYNWTRNKRPSWSDIELERPFNKPLRETDEKIKAFFNGISSWSEKHNLNFFWVREIAYETLDM